jgi:hypothetical protein
MVQSLVSQSFRKSVLFWSAKRVSVLDLQHLGSRLFALLGVAGHACLLITLLGAVASGFLLLTLLGVLQHT